MSFIFRNNVLELRIGKYLSSKSDVAIVENMMENLILLLENAVEHLVFKSGFKLEEEFCFLNEHSIDSIFLRVEILNSSKKPCW